MVGGRARQAGRGRGRAGKGSGRGNGKKNGETGGSGGSSSSSHGGGGADNRRCFLCHHKSHIKPNWTTKECDFISTCTKCTGLGYTREETSAFEVQDRDDERGFALEIRTILTGMTARLSPPSLAEVPGGGEGMLAQPR